MGSLSFNTGGVNEGAIDLFTCAIGKDMLPLIQRLRQALGADNFMLRKIDRQAEVERILFSVQGLS